MSALLPRLSAASVGAAVALAVLGAPTAALAAAPSDPGAAGAARAAQQGPAALPTQAADAAGSATSSTTAAPAGVGSAGGAVAGRSTAQAAATRTDRTESPAATRTDRTERPVASAGRSAAEQRTTNRSANANTPAAKPATPGTPAKADKPANPAKPAKAATVQTVPSKGKDGRPGAAAATGEDAGDPRGNNGTFKVDGPVLDTSHGNEPQVDCAFRLNFYGYDAGQLATIVFTPVAPTPGASTTVSGRQLISTDAAKGGLYNGSYPVTGTWTAADLGLDPTVRQHVKVSVESLNADGSDVPGGAKHKVFWLHPCGSTVPVAVTAAGVPQAPAAETAALPAAFPVGPRTIAAAPAAQPATGALPVMGPHTQPQPQAQVLGATLTAQAAQAATVVAAPAQGARATAATAATAVAPLARPLAQPAMLPFTGSPQVLALLVGGLVALLGGAALVAAARTGA